VGCGCVNRNGPLCDAGCGTHAALVQSIALIAPHRGAQYQ
jgi:hypothetical protein